MLNRQQFLKLTALLLSIYPLKLLYDVMRTSSSYEVKSQQILPMDLPEGISFHGKVIAIQNKGKPVFLSSECPHLGCKIIRQEKGQIVCQCHGSRFSQRGEVIVGPAVKDLLSLSFTTNADTRQYTIDLPS